MGEKRNAYEGLVGKPEGRNPLDNIIKTNLRWGGIG
jgi:hypothetical protein